MGTQHVNTHSNCGKVFECFECDEILELFGLAKGIEEAKILLSNESVDEAGWLGRAYLFGMLAARADNLRSALNLLPNEEAVLKDAAACLQAVTTCLNISNGTTPSADHIRAALALTSGLPEKVFTLGSELDDRGVH